MAGYDPWRGIDYMQQGLASAAQQAPGIEAYRSQNEPVNPMVDATARGLKHILDGGDPGEAAIKARLHLQNPGAAESIWGHPSQSDFAAQQRPQMVASATGGKSAGDTGGLAEGGSPEHPELGAVSTHVIQTPQGEVRVTRPGRVERATPARVDVAQGLASAEPSEPPMRRKDLEDFRSLVPGLTAVAGQRAAGQRLEERLSSVEAEGRANRGTKEAIASQAEQGKKDRLGQILEQKRAQMKQTHADKMAEIAASLQRVREAKGVDQQIAAARIANDLITRYEGDRARFVSSDISILQSPEGKALLDETQPDIDRAKQILYPILNQYKRGGPSGQHQSSSQAAPPNVRQQAAKKLSDAFNE